MDPGCSVFYNFKFDPRVPHSRKLISQNYEILARNPIAKALFPRSNLVASGKRLPNLGEILSPTVQPHNPRNTGGPPVPGQGGPDHPANIRGRGRGNRGRGGRGRDTEGDRNSQTDSPASGQNLTSLPATTQQNGTFHCDYHLRSKNCDVCDHMTE